MLGPLTVIWTQQRILKIQLWIITSINVLLVSAPDNAVPIPQQRQLTNEAISRATHNNSLPLDFPHAGCSLHSAQEASRSIVHERKCTETDHLYSFPFIPSRKQFEEKTHLSNLCPIHAEILRWKRYRHTAMKKNERMEIKLHLFLTRETDTSEWSASRCGNFIPGETTSTAITYEDEWVPEPVWMQRWQQKNSCHYLDQNSVRSITLLSGLFRIKF